MVESFISQKFLDDGVWIAGDWIPWKYQMSLQPATQITQRYDLKLSERKLLPGTKN